MSSKEGRKRLTKVKDSRGTTDDSKCHSRVSNNWGVHHYLFLGVAAVIAALVAHNVTSGKQSENGSVSWRSASAAPTLDEHLLDFRHRPTCNIDRIPLDEWTKVFSSNYHLRKPAILIGWRPKFLAALRHSMQRKELLDKFGNVSVSAGLPFELRNDGRTRYGISIQDFVEGMPSDRYVFDDGQFTQVTGLRAGWQTLPGLEGLGTFDDWKSNPDVGPSLRFSLGGEGQGLSLHMHGDTYSTQLHGQKRWAIYGPHDMPRTGYATTEDFTTWLHQRRNYSDPDFSPPTWECVQEPGEVMYVPEGFYHAVTNYGDAVAFVHQAANPTPGTAHHSRIQAFYASQARQPQVAQQHLKDAIKLDSSNSEYRELVGFECLFAKGCGLRKSVEHFAEAVRMNPLNASHLKLLIIGLFALGRHDEATATIASAVRLGIWIPEAPETGGPSPWGELPVSEIVRREKVWSEMCRESAQDLLAQGLEL